MNGPARGWSMGCFGMDACTPVARDKHWGVFRTFAFGNLYEVVDATVARGGYSSAHVHRRKFNQFYVVRGRLRVRVYGDAPGGPGVAAATFELAAKQSVTVPPGVWHRFEALEDTDLIELYWNDAIDPADIERADEGGLREADAR